MHTSTRGQWSRYEESAYRQARRERRSISEALTRARTERAAHKILPPRDTSDVGDTTTWRLDISELAAATSDPVTDALFGIVCDGATGERILSRVTLPAGSRVVIVARPDDDADPRHDGDCYSPELVSAWEDERWHYVTVEAGVSLPDGREGYDRIGAVETGYHFGLSVEASILHTLAGLVSGALADATTDPAISTPAGPVAAWPV